MELDEHEEEMEEEILPPQTQTGYAAVGGEAAAAAATSSASRNTPGGGHFRYRECLKNHAVGIGGNAVDGCGEFLASGEEGTLDALRCAACGCHRNFHRRESDTKVRAGGSLVYHHFSPYYRAGAPPPSEYLHMTPPTLHRPLALPATSGGGFSREELEDVSNPSSSGWGCGGSRLMKKRSRTKFTPDQKEKMLGFAERLGWRLQRHDEAEVERFCEEIGVRRHVLKVWMHNNKNTLGKKTT